MTNIQFQLFHEPSFIQIPQSKLRRGLKKVFKNSHLRKHLRLEQNSSGLHGLVVPLTLHELNEKGKKHRPDYGALDYIYGTTGLISAGEMSSNHRYKNNNSNDRY